MGNLFKKFFFPIFSFLDISLSEKSVQPDPLKNNISVVILMTVQLSPLILSSLSLSTLSPLSLFTLLFSLSTLFLIFSIPTLFFSLSTLFISPLSSSLVYLSSAFNVSFLVDLPSPLLSFFLSISLLLTLPYYLCLFLFPFLHCSGIEPEGLCRSSSSHFGTPPPPPPPPSPPPPYHFSVFMNS